MTAKQRMSEFVRVARVTDLPDPGKMLVEVGDRLAVLFKIGGRFYCIDDVCTHDGGPLGEGFLEGDQIECPRHGARFDVKSGKALTLPAVMPVRTYPVQIEGDEIKVQVE